MVDILQHPHLRSVSFASETLYAWGSHPNTKKAYFYKWTTSGEPPVGPNSLWDSSNKLRQYCLKTMYIYLFWVWFIGFCKTDRKFSQYLPNVQLHYWTGSQDNWVIYTWILNNIFFCRSWRSSWSLAGSGSCSAFRKNYWYIENYLIE